MKASYDTITNDFRSLVRQTWITHVPFAVLLTIVLYLLLPNKQLHDWGLSHPLASFTLQTIVYAAAIIMAIVAFCHLMPRKQLCGGGKALLRIIRHLGGFLTTGFLGLLMVGVATFLAALPSIILIIAQLHSQLGALDGDPLGVPAYFTPLLLLVFTLTFLVIIYALTWLALSWAYLYGSYKVVDEERKRMKESQGKLKNEIETKPILA